MLREAASVQREIRCIAPIVVDGGTRFRLTWKPEAAHPVFLEQIERLRRPRSAEGDRREGRSGRRPVWLGDDAAEPMVSGVRRQVVVLHVHDRVWMMLNFDTGEARLQLKARELWSRGYEVAALHWLDLMSVLLLRQPLGDLSGAHGIGWRMTGLELCCDFVGLPAWTQDDVGAFVGFRRHETRRKVGGAEQADPVMGMLHGADTVETIDVGARNSSVSYCLYDKDKQIFQAKGGDSSTYDPVHRRHGWRGEPRQRVELRLCKDGLSYVDSSSGEVWDFRDPQTAARPEALRVAWARVTSRKRLALRNTATRRERWRTDPRWEVVHGVAELEPADFEQVRQLREVEEGTWRRRHDRSLDKLARALHQYAQQMDRSADGPSRAADIARVAMIELAARDRFELVTAYGDNYRSYIDAFVGPEVATIGREHWDALSRAIGLHEGDADPDDLFGRGAAARIRALLRRDGFEPAELSDGAE